MDTNKKQCGINDYAEELIHHKARQLVGTAGFTRDDVEDLEQEMRLDLLERLPKFNPNKATYNTFVSRLVERKICNLIRHRTQEIRDFRCEEGSIHDVVESGDSGDEKVERIETVTQDEQDFRLGKHIRSAEARRDLQLDISLVLPKLPPKLRKPAELLQTVSITTAARKLGIPRSTLYDRIARLRRIFEDVGLTNHCSESPTVCPCAG